MKHLRLPILLAALLLAVTACLPGLGTLEPVNVTTEGPHTATAVFTPQEPAVEVIVSFAGGSIEHVHADDPRFQCQSIGTGWDCFVTGQDDAAAPRVVHEAGEAITFNVYASDATKVVGTVFYRTP